MEEGVPIEHKMVTRAIERAQKQVEAQNFSIRKHLLEYDDVMNKQRESVYALRREILGGSIHFDDDDAGSDGGGEDLDSRAYLMTLAEGLLEDFLDEYCGRDVEPEEWDITALAQAVTDLFGLDVDACAASALEGKSVDEMRDLIWDLVRAKYAEKEVLVDAEVFRRVERDVMLQVVDAQWKDHLYSLDHLKEGIGLRGYGQRDPLVEYKRESFEMFKAMRGRIDEETVKYLWRLRPVVRDSDAMSAGPTIRRVTPLSYGEPGRQAAPVFAGAGAAVVEAGGPRPARTGGDDAAVRTVRRDTPKVGRNDRCPCGSGKKYKKCHGA